MTTSDDVDLLPAEQPEGRVALLNRPHTVTPELGEVAVSHGSQPTLGGGDEGDPHGLRPLRGLTTRSEQVFVEIERAIIDGRLKSGKLYPVAWFAAQLGVSRTPVREALLQLARRDMVRFERSRGVRILEPLARDVEEIMEIRSLLEPPAARLAAGRMGQDELLELDEAFRQMVMAARANDELALWHHDRSFHVVILRASGNQRLAQYVDSLRDLILSRDATIAALRSRPFMDLAEEHRPILHAMMARDGEAAAQLMLEHIRHTAEAVVEQETDRQRTGPQ